MREVMFRVLVTVALLMSSGPLFAEPEWFTKWKTFLDEHVLVDTSDDQQQEEKVESAETTPAEPTTPAPVLQPGNPGDFKLSGNWTIIDRSSRNEIGSLKAGGRYFTLKIKDPKVDLRTAYMQSENGAFRCTVLDKQVISMEGRFENRDRIDFQLQVKEIGRPAIQRFEFVARRDS